jgi:hypothetical protein
MTSEIVLMNQRAIAMAADSAVTMFDGSRVIVRNDQRKLFHLAEGLPVGVMFFGLADLMGHPWDVLVDHYAAHNRPKPLAHVSDYAEGVFGLLDTLESFFPPARHRDEYKRLVLSVYRFIFRLSDYLQSTGTEGPDEAILGEAIDLVWTRYQSHVDGRPRRNLDCFPPGFADTITREYSDTVKDLIGYAFRAFSLDLPTRERLRDIAVFCVVKDLFLEDVTGLVFGGYGSGDHYPGLVTYNASAVIKGIVKRARVDDARIDGDIHASIALFAESDASYAFLSGIDLDLEARVYDTVQEVSSKLVDDVVGRFGGVDPVLREGIRREAQEECVPQAVESCYRTLTSFQRSAYIDPILSVVEISTRQDLAETVHDLVALNIFKKRISGQEPTVGGAIDVAVISRDAGFTWWKRQEVKS